MPTNILPWSNDSLLSDNGVSDRETNVSPNRGGWAEGLSSPTSDIRCMWYLHLPASLLRPASHLSVPSPHRHVKLSQWRRVRAFPPLPLSCSMYNFFSRSSSLNAPKSSPGRGTSGQDEQTRALGKCRRIFCHRSRSVLHLQPEFHDGSPRTRVPCKSSVTKYGSTLEI